jgi:hypothetical protein
VEGVALRSVKGFSPRKGWGEWRWGWWEGVEGWLADGDGVRGWVGGVVDGRRL